jgi:IS1 family transposase
MDQIKVWFFGDSFTYGVNCDPGDAYYEKYYTEGCLKWTEIVAKQYNAVERNCGTRGLGNIEILDRLLTQGENILPNDVVIVGASDGSRTMSFQNTAINTITTSVNHWLLENDTQLDKEYRDSMINYVVNCRMPFFKRHEAYDTDLMIKTLNIIKPSQYVVWGTDKWPEFELISNQTNKEINDNHWSYNGHKQMADWIISHLETKKERIITTTLLKDL